MTVIRAMTETSVPRRGAREVPVNSLGIATCPSVGLGSTQMGQPSPCKLHFSPPTATTVRGHRGETVAAGAARPCRGAGRLMARISRLGKRGCQLVKSLTLELNL